MYNLPIKPNLSYFS